TVEINYNSDTPIAGFQFTVEDVDVTGVSGGAAGAAGFTLSTGNNIVVGFSLAGTTIPIGEGVLVVLDFTGSGDPCISDFVMSDSNGDALDATVEDCTTISIGEYCAEDYDECGVCGGDSSSCEDCLGVPNGDAVEDECGVCDGPGATEECGCEGIPDGACDCDGNVVDECGVCNGDGEVMCWDGTTYVCDASECPDQPSDTVDINYNSDTPIAGIQFTVEGVDVTGVSGGAAGAAGFSVS
ncbi:uncharacterized protein METZ01_LOCUS485127, partial [marine metagenome]